MYLNLFGECPIKDRGGIKKAACALRTGRLNPKKPNENNLPFFAFCPRSLAKTYFIRDYEKR